MKRPSPVPITFDRHGQEAVSMVGCLQSEGYQAYLAGGCVRDLIMGRQPHDYDIATNASPEQILHLFPNACAVGRAFPVVRLTERGRVVDIASFRQEGTYLDGRHPVSTSPGSLEQDAQRRDFTVNALYLDPQSHMIVDEVDGLIDLHKRQLRFVGDPNTRLEEDHLRLMRAVRFSTSLDLVMEPATFEAVKRHAGRLARISADRIRDELIRTLCEATRPADALLLLMTSGLLTVILPEPFCAATRLAHVQALLEQVETRVPELMLAILFYPLTEFQPTQRETRSTLESLRFSSDCIHTVLHTLALQQDLIRIDMTDRARVRRLIADPTFTLAYELRRLTCIATDSSTAVLQTLSAFRDSMPQPDWLPSPWITGDDLIALGVQLGPRIAQWKHLAHDEQLRGHHADRVALLSWLNAKLRESA